MQNWPLNPCHSVCKVAAHVHTGRRLSLHALKGFTLLELMITVAIVGVLASFSIAAYQKATVRARWVENMTVANTIRKDMYECYVGGGKDAASCVSQINAQYAGFTSKNASSAPTTWSDGSLFCINIYGSTRAGGYRFDRGMYLNEADGVNSWVRCSWDTLPDYIMAEVPYDPGALQRRGPRP